MTIILLCIPDNTNQNIQLFPINSDKGHGAKMRQWRDVIFNEICGQERSVFWPRHVKKFIECLELSVTTCRTFYIMKENETKVVSWSHGILFKSINF
jgi:hypothetical protein